MFFVSRLCPGHLSVVFRLRVAGGTRFDSPVLGRCNPRMRLEKVLESTACSESRLLTDRLDGPLRFGL